MPKQLNEKQLEQRGAVLVAECDTHQLFEFPGRTSRGWRGLYLRLVNSGPNPQTKRVWWLGHDGTRLARNTDAKKLAGADLQTYHWVDETLKGLA
ncbi:MAG: hypothetical protein A49_14130 [Methyloceanibacter sp.]|nr:MAG: hypothetical protein A49_14130 [Methyloceanibacter sp.]